MLDMGNICDKCGKEVTFQNKLTTEPIRDKEIIELQELLCAVFCEKCKEEFFSKNNEGERIKNG